LGVEDYEVEEVEEEGNRNDTGNWRFKLHFDESVAREVDQVKIIETAACQQLFGHGL
jgi:hypothetical protein